MRSSKLIMSFALILSACNSYGSDNSYYPPGPASDPGPRAGFVSVTLPTTAPMLSKGETRSAIAVVKDADGGFVNAPTVVWTSSAPGVATVTGTGSVATITAVEDGTTTITATSAGAHTTVTINVRRMLASIVVVNQIPVIGPGSTVQLNTSARDAMGFVIPSITNFTYTSSAPGRVIVSATGLVTALIATPVIRIVASATSDGFTVSGFANLGVVAPNTFDYASYMNGDEVRPTPVTTTAEGFTYLRINDNRINYLITWTKLSGPATGVQIRGPAGFNEVGSVLVDFATPNQGLPWGILNNFFTEADILPQGGRPAISVDSLVSLMRRGQAYVSVRTAANPNGEIRGSVEGPFR